MVFSSLTFLFAFLPITAVLYYIVPNRLWRNAVLLADGSPAGYLALPEVAGAVAAALDG